MSLKHLDVSKNRLAGPIPVAVLKLRYAAKRVVHLEGNAGLEIPPDVGELTETVARDKGVDLGNLGLVGPIPVAVLRWKFVEGHDVNLRDNAALELPANIGELGDTVATIALSHHHLRGRIPEDIGLCTALRELWLVNNDIEGAIPASMQRLKQLEMLYLSFNSDLQKPPGIKGDHLVFGSKTPTQRFLASLTANRGARPGSPARRRKGGSPERGTMRPESTS